MLFHISYVVAYHDEQIVEDLFITATSRERALDYAVGLIEQSYGDDCVLLELDAKPDFALERFVHSYSNYLEDVIS